MTSKQDDAPVSFTDTNAETGMTGKAGSTSNMMDLVGQLKKSKDMTKDTSSGTSKKESKSESGGGKKKKKKKKGKKGKSKYKRRQDRYEPENFLLRIEGSVCCGLLISIIIYILYNLLVLAVVIIWSGGKIDHLHNTRPL